MTQENASSSIEARVDALETAFGLNRGQARNTQRAATAITLGLCATIFIFALINYFNLKSNWAHADFAESLQKEAVEISPALEKQLQELSRSILPVYAQEGQKQVSEKGPDIAKEINQEVDLLCEDTERLVHDRLLELEKRVSDRSTQIAYEALPFLKDSSDREKFEKELHAICDNALLEVFATFEERFTRELDAVKETLLSFDQTDTGESEVDLQKRFIRLWLRVLDLELSEL